MNACDSWIVELQMDPGRVTFELSRGVRHQRESPGETAGFFVKHEPQTNGRASISDPPGKRTS